MSTETGSHQPSCRLDFGALACLLALTLSAFPIVDPDILHEMALGREALQRGGVPHEDPFAFTPTRSPMVHHEWGTGTVLGVTEEILAFYAGAWRRTLSRFGADLVLCRSSQAIRPLLEGAGDWRRVNRDDLFELWSRPGLEMTPVDRRGERIEVAFP